GVASTALALSAVGWLLVYGYGEPRLIVWGLGSAVLAMAAGAIGLGLALLRPARYSGVGRASLAAAASAVLLLAVVPHLEIRAPMFTNERVAIGDVRSIMAAELAYASSNGDAYGELECLAAPTNCGFPNGTPPFLDAEVAA